jgi:hypothetical protein
MTKQTETSKDTCLANHVLDIDVRQQKNCPPKLWYLVWTSMCANRKIARPSCGTLYLVELDAREMKCEGRHTVHSNCLGVTGVIDRFVEKKHNTCPNCRHDFSDFFSTDIEANLEHRQPNGIEIIAHWSKPPNLIFLFSVLTMPLAH